MLQNQLLLNFLDLPRGMAPNSVSLVPLTTACRICHLKDKLGYLGHYFVNSCYCTDILSLLKDFDACSRQLLLRYNIFWFLVEKKRPYNVHKKASCGDLHLFLRHSWVIRFFVCHCHLWFYSDNLTYKEDCQIFTRLSFFCTFLGLGWYSTMLTLSS